MRRLPRRVGRLEACLAVAVLLLVAGGSIGAQPVKPNYLVYLEFADSDPPDVVTLKHAYNDAVSKYNRALYDYLVTLERHDRLVELHNSSPDPAEKKRARDEAQPLRTRLAELRREVHARAATVDQTGRRAAAGGISVPR